MHNTSPLDPRITTLDPEILSTPYTVQTNWHVITGAICSGKTTLINLLAERGYQILPETARMYIEAQVASGRCLEDIFSNKDDEITITKLQCEAEKRLRPAEIVFLDRALPDSLWFFRLHGLDPNEFLPECLNNRYASVYILDQLPVELDGARIEDKDYTDLLEEALVADYSALGYKIIRVPVLSPKERVDFILKNLPQ